MISLSDQRSAEGNGIVSDWLQAWRRAVAVGVRVLDAPILRVLLVAGYLERWHRQFPIAEAYKWFDLAAASERDPTLRGWAVEELNLLEHRMTAEQVASAQKLATEWSPRSKWW